MSIHEPTITMDMTPAYTLTPSSFYSHYTMHNPQCQCERDVANAREELENFCMTMQTLLENCISHAHREHPRHWKGKAAEAYRNEMTDRIVQPLLTLQKECRDIQSMAMTM